MRPGHLYTFKRSTDIALYTMFCSLLQCYRVTTPSCQRFQSLDPRKIVPSLPASTTALLLLPLTRKHTLRSTVQPDLLTRLLLSCPPALRLTSKPPSSLMEAPFSPSLSTAFRSTLSLPSPPHEPIPPPLSPIERLPPELIEAIAFAVCRRAPVGPPTPLITLFLLSRRFYDVLGPRNEGFYADLFRERFDWRSVERRWAAVSLREGRCSARP